MRRMKNSKVLNPSVLMGMVGQEAAPADILMWGNDPVHPKRDAYKTMAERILDEIINTANRKDRATAAHPAEVQTEAQHSPAG